MGNRSKGWKMGERRFPHKRGRGAATRRNKAMRKIVRWGAIDTLVAATLFGDSLVREWESKRGKGAA